MCWMCLVSASKYCKPFDMLLRLQTERMKPYEKFKVKSHSLWCFSNSRIDRLFTRKIVYEILIFSTYFSDGSAFTHIACRNRWNVWISPEETICRIKLWEISSTMLQVRFTAFFNTKYNVADFEVILLNEVYFNRFSRFRALVSLSDFSSLVQLPHKYLNCSRVDNTCRH